MMEGSTDILATLRARQGRTRRSTPARPQSLGWRARAEDAQGALTPDPSSTLSASEIGAYAFCPQAWFLQRCRVPTSAEADARRAAGSRRHRSIGRQTDVVRAAGALQAALIAAAGVALLLLVWVLLGGVAWLAWLGGLG